MILHGLDLWWRNEVFVDRGRSRVMNPSLGFAKLSREELARLLLRTSRTFALAIPLLEPTLERQVGLAYLLLRIADTLEDAPRWDRAAREAALVSFERWLVGAHDVLWLEQVALCPPTSDEGCLELLDRSRAVLAAIHALGEEPSRIILAQARRTVCGMTRFVAQQSPGGALVLENERELLDYAYVVAGIVGELLTDLFVAAVPALGAESARQELARDAAKFGVGLQLVNIIKDADADAKEGRRYLPADVTRARAIDIARADLERAARYVQTLVDHGASMGVVAFTALPLRLAEATLDALERGDGKLRRDVVERIYAMTRSTASLSNWCHPRT